MLAPSPSSRDHRLGEAGFASSPVGPEFLQKRIQRQENDSCRELPCKDRAARGTRRSWLCRAGPGLTLIHKRNTHGTLAALTNAAWQRETFDKADSSGAANALEERPPSWPSSNRNRRVLCRFSPPLPNRATPPPRRCSGSGGFFQTRSSCDLKQGRTPHPRDVIPLRAILPDAMCALGSRRVAQRPFPH